MRKITNEEFEEALAKPDNRKIMNAAAIPYISTISYDELEQCKFLALWRAMQAFKPNGCKFTSFLFRSVELHCTREVKKQYKNKISVICPTVLPDRRLNHIELADLEDAIDSLPDDLRDIIKQRFFDKLTLKEIAQKNKFSGEWANRKIKKALERLSKIFNND